MAKLERSYLFKVLYDRIAVWENYPIIFMLNRFKFPLKVWRFSTRRFCSRCCMEAGCSIKEAFLLWLGSQSINAQPLKKIVWRRKMWTIIIIPSRSSAYCKSSHMLWSFPVEQKDHSQKLIMVWTKYWLQMKTPKRIK